MAPSPQLNFSESPVHTDEYYADVIARMIAGDARRRRSSSATRPACSTRSGRGSWIRLMPGARRAGGTPLEMHFHNRTAMANLNHIIGVEEGVRIVHSAISTLANGVSMPSTEVTVDNLRRLGHEVAVDDSRLAEVAEHFGAPRRRRTASPARRPGRVPGGRHPAAVPGRDDGDAARTARSRYGMADRLPEVLEEAIRVRAEMG